MTLATPDGDSELCSILYVPAEKAENLVPVFESMVRCINEHICHDVHGNEEDLPLFEPVEVFLDDGKARKYALFGLLRHAFYVQ